MIDRVEGCTSLSLPCRTTGLKVVSDTVSEALFNVTAGNAALYALVEPSGSGALMNIRAGAGSTSPLVCSWKTSPKLVHVQTVEFAAGTLGANDSDVYPALAGRATLKTLEGMAQAARNFGAVLPDGSSAPRPPILTLSFYERAVSPEQVLATLLADGGKASMTAYNVHEWELQYMPRTRTPTLCDPRVVVCERESPHAAALRVYRGDADRPLGLSLWLDEVLGRQPVWDCDGMAYRPLT